MKTRRIVCVGSGLIHADAVGPRVYRELRRREHADWVEIVDGGLAGMNLLPYFNDCAVLVLVDRVIGFAETVGTVVCLTHDEICRTWHGSYAPSSELLYLLKSLPFLSIVPFPDIFLVGIEGAGEGAVIRQASDLALEIAHEGS